MSIIGLCSSDDLQFGNGSLLSLRSLSILPISNRMGVLIRIFCTACPASGKVTNGMVNESETSDPQLNTAR